MSLIRWHAVAYYRTEDGTVDVHHDLAEIADLHYLIERGRTGTPSTRSRCGRSITSRRRT